MTGMRNRFSVAGSGADLRERQYVYPVSRPTEKRPALWRDFGGVKIAEIVHNDATGHRCSGAWPIGGDGACVLMLNLEGTTALTDMSAEFRLQPGDLLVVDAGLPLRRAGHVRGRGILVSLPQAPIPMPEAPCLIDSGDGIAAVLGGLISTLLHGTGPFCGREQAALRDVIVQLVAAACSARRQCSSRPIRPRDASAWQWHVLQQSVEALLSDPALSPAIVAASHGISTRHVHRLFRQAGISFNTYVRTRRLQHCRDDLMDPHLGALRLTEIAYRWGFSDSSHFSRCFKAAFGCTAREFRGHGLLRTDSRGRPYPSSP